jgi:hypothetical protein
MEPAARSSTLSLKTPDTPDKASDKARIHKDKGNAGGNGGVAVTQAESGVSPVQQDPASMTANPAIATQATESIAPGGNTSEPALKSRNSNKADTNSGLAFALRIQGNDPVAGAASQMNLATNPNLDTADPNAQAAAGTFSSQVADFMQPLEPKAAAKSGTSNDTVSSGATTLLNIGSLAAGQAAANSVDDPKPAEEVAPTANVPEDQPASAQQVKTVQVQITGADDQKVDLKLIEKSGALTMSVRSSDRSLTAALQQNLPDLTNKLSDQQIRADWWRPDAQSAESSGNSSGSGSSGNNSPHQDHGNSNQSGSNQSGSNQSGSGQRGGRGTPEPEWLEDLSLSPKSNQNGTQFSWHL